MVVWLAMTMGGDKVNTNKAENNEPIKIGYIGALTGDVSSLGASSASATEFAVKKFNDAGGINGRKIELIKEDGACNAKTASNAGTKLIDVDKVVAIIGGLCSSETLAFGPKAMQNKVVMISYLSSSPALSKLGKYFFRDYPSDSYQGKYAAEYIYNKMGIKNVAVVYHNSDWGTGVREVFVSRFKELGGSIVLDEGVSQESRDYRTIVSKVKASKAELLFTPTYTEGGLVFLNQIKDSGLKIKIFGADAWGDTKFQEQVSGSLGAIYASPKTPDSKEFVDKFTKAYPDQKVGTGVRQAYDATNILLNAIKKVGTSNPDKLAATIRATDIQGVSGHIAFDANGDMTEAEYVLTKLLGAGKTEEVK